MFELLQKPAEIDTDLATLYGHRYDFKIQKCFAYFNFLKRTNGVLHTVLITGRKPKGRLSRLVEQSVAMLFLVGQAQSGHHPYTWTCAKCVDGWGTFLRGHDCAVYSERL